MGLLVSAFVGVFIYCIFLILYLKKEEVEFSKVFTLGLCIFAFYIVTVLSITGPGHILDIGIERERTISLVPFKFQDGNLFGMITNIILFIPLGVFLPSLWNKFEKFLNTILVGFSFSLIIEVLQLLNMRATDIDDLLMNTLGAAIGYLIYILLFKKLSSRIKLNNLSNKFWIKYNGELIIILILALDFFIAPFIENFLIKTIFGI
ncbi:VanZ family protein [Clostridium sp. LIBA-8841]|uniref:VanZ family protein n=1 Tax=Clostridium sp. LIBA-8841 TaxID=2987530 RepID=UPI002AC789E6|nr:VanZ family protein [Clostridium sp. LIBA-8841]MDZ5252973.1 VanZ family protein [Clostridium sp. LIBA-8841]